MDYLQVIFVSALLYASLLPGDCIKEGREAAPHSRPYMASLQQDGKHHCGGFLVAKQWIMSAAHCFLDDTNFQVVLGTHSLSKPEDTKQTFTIDTLYKHPDFQTSNYDNDIALIKLGQPITESDAVKPLKFQRSGDVELVKDMAVDTAGWGSLNNLGKRPDVLHELSIEIIDRKFCERSDYYGTAFTSNMLCAAKKRMDTCDGDSGGPLLYKGIAVGITSNGGKKCGSAKRPGLYTIISHYDDWITRTMSK